ncbi:ADP-ribosyl-(dinitrogen reductase) hydrolase [Pasteurella multocida]|nr:DUF4258 domain-containing protein [Pasteurella multocida]OPC89027.1 hypothetical protein BTV51_05480 [Pasteurella multocida subsp. septica]MBE7394348.1 DUF4258 domain-containing protein [Pasteurella multocida]NNI14135.1 ADP-ribosyl-(dinitrogen reductase) hydrolase [Pasteurella multocida]NNI18389.1 ADP-ribosyl-(dinitrogen reductase) hydrolase [Pasteurella multocida]
MKLIISDKIVDKLKKKHSVSINEIYECISNIDGKLIEDTAEEHKTIPPSFWFISETNRGRKLKVVIVPVGNILYLKTAFDAKSKHIQLYESLND